MNLIRSDFVDNDSIACLRFQLALFLRLISISFDCDHEVTVQFPLVFYGLNIMSDGVNSQLISVNLAAKYCFHTNDNFIGDSNDNNKTNKNNNKNNNHEMYNYWRE